MKLTDLSKPQWDAALSAAQCLCQSNPDIAEDRAAFRAAKARLVELLPADANANDVVSAAVRWNALNDIACAFAGIPVRVGIAA